MLDGLILAALAFIIAWLLSRALARTYPRHDAPDHGSDDLYLARAHGELLAEKMGATARKARGDGAASNGSPVTSHDIAHRNSVNNR